MPPRSAPETPLAPAAPPLPSPGLILRTWLSIGMHSFGGGATTLTLIRRAVVDRYGWLSEVEFTREWTLCQLAPGINLLGIAILIGRRLDGARGIALALLGLLLPSVALTIVITAGYAAVQSAPAVQAALRGIVPATVGLGLVTAYQTARPALRENHREGAGKLLAGVLLLIGAGAAVALWRRPVVLVLLVAGGISAAIQWAVALAGKAPRE